MVKRKPKLSPAEIRELLRLKGWSQAELGRQLDVSEAAISLWLSGARTSGGPAHLLMRQWLAEARAATSN